METFNTLGIVRPPLTNTMNREQLRTMIEEELEKQNLLEVPLNNRKIIDHIINVWINEIQSIILRGTINMQDIIRFKRKLQELQKALLSGKYK